VFVPKPIGVVYEYIRSPSVCAYSMPTSQARRVGDLCIENRNVPLLNAEEGTVHFS
jgi:hypothetical protein